MQAGPKHRYFPPPREPFDLFRDNLKGETHKEHL